MLETGDDQAGVSNGTAKGDSDGRTDGVDLRRNGHAFLVRVLGGFPADGSPTSIPASAPTEEAYGAESINEAAQMFSSKYMSVVDEIASFQTDP